MEPGSLPQKTSRSELGDARLKVLFSGFALMILSGLSCGLQNSRNKISLLTNPGTTPDPLAMNLHVAGIIVGLFLVICGLFIYRKPLAVTVISLIVTIAYLLPVVFFAPPMAGVLIVYILMALALGQAVLCALEHRRKLQAGMSEAGG